MTFGPVHICRWHVLQVAGVEFRARLPGEVIIPSSCAANIIIRRPVPAHGVGGYAHVIAVKAKRDIGAARNVSPAFFPILSRHSSQRLLLELEGYPRFRQICAR